MHFLLLWNWSRFSENNWPIQHCHHAVRKFWNIMGAGTLCVPRRRCLAENLNVSFKYYLSFSSHLAGPLINCSLIHPDVPVTSLAPCPFPTPPNALYLLITVNDRVLFCSLPSDKVVNTIGVTGKTPFFRCIFQIALQRGQLCHPWWHSLVPPHALELNSQFSDTEGNFPSEKPISCYLPWNSAGLSGKQARGSSGQV